jgi:hypothetical protein
MCIHEPKVHRVFTCTEQYFTVCSCPRVDASSSILNNHQARQEHETLTARISELETEIEENNVNNKLLAESMDTERAESSEKLEHCTTDNAALQLRVKELEQSLSSFTQQLKVHHLHFSF